MVIYSSIGEAKYLSLTINQDVKWKMYVNNVCMKANKGISLRPSRDIFMSIFTVFGIQPHKPSIQYFQDCHPHQGLSVG
jgi:hypothetical protein